VIRVVEYGHDPSANGADTAGLFEVLAHPYRRFVISSLDDADDATVQQLAADLAAWQAELPASERSARSADGIALLLHHNHLPKMAEADVIKYDLDRRLVRPAERAGEAVAFLDESGNE
jgi:hypothetical protein